MERAEEDVAALLDKLAQEGHLVAWTEMDDGVYFDCWRLDPMRYPEAYKEVPDVG